MKTPFAYAEEKQTSEVTEYFNLYMNRLRKLLQGAINVCITEPDPARAQGEAHAYKKSIELWDGLLEELKKEK